MLGLVRGDLLPIDHPWTRTRLDLEARHDATLRRWIAGQGLPDYLLVESRMRLRIFYVRADQMVVFQREDMQDDSTAEVVPWIGALYHARFSDADRLALGELRFERAGLVMNPKWKDPRPASERNADAVADLDGQEPWRPGGRSAPAPAAPPGEPEDQEVAFSAESGNDVAFSASSRGDLAFAAWSTAIGPRGLVRFSSTSASMGRWSTARADAAVRRSRSLR